MGFPSTRDVEIVRPTAPLPGGGNPETVSVNFAGYRKLAIYILQGLAGPGNQIAVELGYSFVSTLGPTYRALIRTGTNATAVDELVIPAITANSFWLICAANPGGAERLDLILREVGNVGSPSAVQIAVTAGS